MPGSHRVVIVGGGFGGLQAARSLRRAPASVTLIDRRNFHLFQPLLYQVATGGLSPANIAVPLRAILKRQKNARVLLGEATGIDVAGRRVILADGEVPYDTLIVAAGSRHHYFGHDPWEASAPGLKTVEDATLIRRRVLQAFESAERRAAAASGRADPAPRGAETAAGDAWMTIVIVGGGPTGVELAGAVAELARHTFKDEFRSIDPGAARIVLLEGAGRILPSFPPGLSMRAAEDLARLGVTVRAACVVEEVEPEGVVVRNGADRERIPARTVLWAAGVQASPLGGMLAAASGGSVDGAGRVMVGPDLTLPGHPEIFVIGDLALVRGIDGRPLPALAPVAIQQGRYAAARVEERLRGKGEARGAGPAAFRYRDLGAMATIGRAAAVAEFGRFQLTGYPAWLFWLFVHLMSLVQYESRLLVLVQWAWNYFTRNRSARLITGVAPGTESRGQK